MSVRVNRLAIIVPSICFCWIGRLVYAEEATSSPQQFQTKASFSLNVESSTNLKKGPNTLQTSSAFATYTNEFFGGKTNALKVQFFSQPITEDDRVKLLKNDTGEISRQGYAALVLFLDERNQVWQVNLTYTIPGTTVVRTVAGNREELTKHFSDCHFDQHRLRLKSKGSYRSAEATEALTLAWGLDLNLPVFDQVKK